MRGAGERDHRPAAGDEAANASASAAGKRTLIDPQDQAAASPPGLLVDREPLGPGAMLKGAFLDQLKAAVMAATDDEMGAAGASADCPYLTEYFARYAGQPAAASVRLIDRWVAGARDARSAEALIPMIVARVREGVRGWRASGALPPELVAADPAFAAQATARATGPGQPMTLGSLEAQLGPGQAVDGATASRMSGAIGADVSGARVHQGPAAAELAARHDATAFAVGQNVVLGGGAPAPGTFAADALMAHELAHTAQQRDAARDPAARHRPIGPEDPAAERDAGAARLANFAGALGDVMRTGLQLQRCPDKVKLPPGPPMEGVQADKYIANIPLIAERIKGDIDAGIKAEGRTKFYDTQDAFARAWLTESPQIASIWKPDAKPGELDKMRWEAAQQAAAKGGGFTNYFNDTIHIYKPDTPAFVTIHETIHLHTKDRIYQVLGSNFVEGVADYYTEIVCKQNKVEFVSVYSDQLAAIKGLAAAVGDDALADLVFAGNIEAVEAIVDSKGKDTWKQYRRALNADDYGTAAILLAGVRQANDARVAKEQADNAAKEKQGRDAHEAERAKERKAWPPEGKKPVSGRMLRKSVGPGGKGHVLISRGGGDGVRESWKARCTLKDKSVIDARVLSVDTRTTTIEVADLTIADAIVTCELRRPSP